MIVSLRRSPLSARGRFLYETRFTAAADLNRAHPDTNPAPAKARDRKPLISSKDCPILNPEWDSSNPERWGIGQL
jgi:hypothetical protein